MPKNLLDHLFLDERFYNAKDYSTDGGGQSVLARSDVNREQHGNSIKVRFEQAVDDFKQGIDERDFVYLELISVINFELDLEKFDDKRVPYRIAYVKKIEEISEEGVKYCYYKSGIYLDTKAIEDFLDKVGAYLTEYTPKSSDSENPIPKFNALISNIEDIQAATLKSFWQEYEIPFPAMDASVWWEVWIDNRELNGQEIAYLSEIFDGYNVQIGNKWLRFPEHSVGLVKGSATELSLSLLYSNRLAELRKPRETSDFFMHLDRHDQHEWINDLRERTENRTNESLISVCLLDSGVNRSHPLLENLIPENHTDTVIPEAGVADIGGSPSGHGTPMAGLILYGNLTEAMDSPNAIQIFHQLESIKLMSANHPHDPQNYGAVTQEAIDRGLLINVDHKRVVCMAVTSDELEHKGKPSSWSAAIDQYSFGTAEDPNNIALILISAGNILPDKLLEYPLSNGESSIHDPAQAFNAITVGAYTQMDTIDLILYPDASPLANRGALSPSSCTSLSWDSFWCRKPDIVMEGGNYAVQHGELSQPDSLLLLSTAKGTTGKLLATFGDTSGATALASRLAAQLYHHYPHLWPETIRALVVHSASWTSQMLGKGIDHIGQLSEAIRIELLKQVGYGIPNLQKATYSASNSLSLLAEATLKPLRKTGSDIKSDEFHLYKLPWPIEELMGLGETPVELVITLSYFVEPNPGNKRYSIPNNYASHGLRFKMIHALESPKQFAGRVSKAMRGDHYQKQTISSGWLLGDDVRNKGSIHKDIWRGTAADLATRDHIAIYPTAGWWKARKKLKRYDKSVRYSLVISIEMPNVEVDIYNVVKNQVDIAVPISIEI